MVAGFDRCQDGAEDRKRLRGGHSLQKLELKSGRGDGEGYSIRCLANTSRLKLTTDAQT